jgi:predicted Zn-dependent protease with MMP-like domain
VQRTNSETFEKLVDEAMEQLPAGLRARIQNLAVKIQDRPTRGQTRRWDIAPEEELLGFYEGVPLTERTTNYGMIAPDVIYIFQQAIEESCSSDDEIRSMVRQTVRHEIAHYFGIGDERLEELDRY